MKKILLFFTSVFMLFILVSCGAKDDYKYSVVCPNGAPAISISKIYNEENYNLVSADTIGAQFKAKDDYDFIIAPVNAGAVQFKNGNKKYKLGAVLTWGNLYFATTRTDIDKIEDFEGKEITLFGAGTINEAIAKYVLKNKNINVTYATALGSVALTANELKTKDDVIVLTAEPVLTTISNALSLNNKNVKSFSVSKLYEEVSDKKSYTQAGLFINTKTIEEHKSVVDNFLNDVKKSCEFVNSHLEETATLCSNYKIIADKNIGLKAIPNCNISFKKALDAKKEVEATANIDLSIFGGVIPEDEFYYNK